MGFRPTVFRYATQRNLSGWVTNTSTGVIIEIEGNEEKIESFIYSLKNYPPPHAQITRILVTEIQPRNESIFQVLPSVVEKKVKTRVSPEIATCKDCLKELFNSEDRRYLYPFINCTNCGPRFTIIRNVPYDRENTTMKKFVMCSLCQEEYENPGNRRFHAQPNACPVCGPQVQIVKDFSKTLCKGNKAVRKTIQLLSKGKIVAIKGLGGFHLACDATNEEAVRTLRRRKYREDKPFALMAKNLEIVEKYCAISPEEEELLSSFRAPIVLLRRREGAFPPIAGNVAPKNKYLGFMLPYTPLHHLLFYNSPLQVLVMTSGNLSDEPIAYENTEAIKRLSKIADYFLLHDRDIYIRSDDSVARIFPLTREPYIIRRSRGYVPEPIRMPGLKISIPILACGGHSKNTFAIASEDEIVISHHIGDMENIETYNSFTEGIEHFKKLLQIQPRGIAHDLHPAYLSTEYAKEVAQRDPQIELFPVQHHHAHIASVMADNGLENQKIIGVAFDGTGFGSDGNLWGGEFLVADYCKFERVAHLKYIPLPGGEKAIKEPWRITFAYLYATFGERFLSLKIDFVQKVRRSAPWKILKKMIDEGINTPLTSSMGRFFDAVSSLLSLRDRVNYEGQAAIELEMLLNENQRLKPENQRYNYKIERKNGVYIIDYTDIIKEIVADLNTFLPKESIALRFHHTIVDLIVRLVEKISEDKNIKEVGLSGGVFQNMFLLTNTYKKLREKGFTIYLHNNVPTNDGGLSLGQAVISAYRKIREPRFPSNLL